MKTLNLRSQLAIVAGIFLVYSIGVGCSFWIETQAHNRLGRQFHESLTVLSRLPHLRDRLRRTDQATGQYLMTGQNIWLDRRDEAIQDIRETTHALDKVLTDPRGRKMLDEMDRRLTTYLAESSQWISRRRSGRLSALEAARFTRRGGELEFAASPLSELGAENISHLLARREELERVSLITAILIILTGAASAGIVAVFLSRYLTGPISALRERARGWTLGREWNFHPTASPEVADLCETIAEMTRRLNTQFEKESELGRLKGNLVSMASHEFNNSLSVLGGTSELLKKTESPPPSGRRAEYYTILDSTLRALALATSNLLDLGRLESGRFAVRPRRADMKRVLEDAAKSLEPLYLRKSIVFSLDIPEKSSPALADPEAILLVASNLIGNAIKYTGEGGTVTAGVVSMENDRIKIFVRDNGIGIAAEDREKILSGHRTEAGRQAAKGFGVGLTLVKKMLDAHATTLEIEGAPGQGSCFSFILPCWKNPVEGDLFF